MTQRRPRTACSHGDAGRPYPVVEDPGWTLGQDPARDEALAQLEQVLTPCREMLATAIEQLSAADVMKALKSVPLQHRGSVFKPLGLNIKPRQITRQMSQDTRALLLRGANNDVRHAARMLTATVSTDIGRAVFDGAGPDPVESWGAPLCQAAIWADRVASVRDARVWLWASRQPWFAPERITVTQRENIAGAAQRVIDASPAFGADEEVVVSAVGEPLEDLHTAVGSLEPIFEKGAVAARRIAEQLSAKQVPASQDLADVVRTRESFDEVTSSLINAGLPAPGDTLGSLRAAIDQASAEERDGDLRSSLAVLCELAASPEEPMLVAQLAQVHAEAAELMSQAGWDEQARKRAESLRLLIDLATPAVGKPAPIELVMRWSEFRPELSFLALHAARLAQTDADSVTSEPAEVRHGDAPVAPVPVIEEPSEQAIDDVQDVENDAQDVEDEPNDTEAPLVRDVARLVSGARFGLAAAIGAAESRPEAQLATLRVAALADAVRFQHGAVAAMLRDELAQLEPDSVVADTPSLLLVVPALIRAALVTGEPTTGALLTELAPRLEPNLKVIAEEVGRRALHGVLADARALVALADVAEGERSLLSLASTAKQFRVRHRTFRFKRATDISKVWLGSQGMLGRPLGIVERNDTRAVDEVAAAIERLASSTFVRNELDALDGQYQGSSGKPIEGAGRRDLLDLAREALTPLAEWVTVVRSLRHDDGQSTWGTGEVADMRAAVLGRSDAVAVALKELAGHDDPMVAAAAMAAAASLEETFGVLRGARTLTSVEPAPEYVLTAELAKMPGAVIDNERVTLPSDVSVGDLRDAADRSWDDALTLHIDGERFGVAWFLLDKARAGRLPAGDLSDREVQAKAVEAAEQSSREALLGELEQFAVMLGRARSNDEIAEEQDGDLTGLLDGAREQAKGHNLADVRLALRKLDAQLSNYRAESRARLEVRLDKLKLDGRVDESTSARVTELMTSGQLSTAEELIYFLEVDEKLPEIEEAEHLRQFVPAVPQALPRGVTAELVMQVRNREVVGTCPILDFTQLSSTQAQLAAETLESWRDLSLTEPGQRYNIGEKAHLIPVLRMMGLETGQVDKLSDWPRGRDRRFVEVVVTGQVGRVLVPAFGSKLRGRLRVLLVWGQPNAELLMSWADGDTSDESLLITHFGTMSMQTRRDLAVLAASRTAPIVVLDDAALAYLAAYSGGQMTTTMKVLLPFSGVNPYLQKRGVVAPEMFYGRDQERRSVLDPDGTQLVFGGRGLGKSALLHSAAEHFESQSRAGADRVAIYLDLKVVGIRANSPKGQNAIWDALLDKLQLREVLRAPRKNAGRRLSRNHIEHGVREWLQVNTQRRLLVLIDEADQFFEADMPDFHETAALKALGQESNGRVKVVFAGLHSVQRYAKKARNAPFSHMAQRPTVIGPLKPQHAANLLSEPLAALGFEFEDPDLVNRILGYCSYQPFLLQMFANRLVEVMHAKRRGGVLGVDEPPYVIARLDVEAVQNQADLRSDIRTAFRDTLNLDHRYGVIAHVLAHYAYENGLDARLTAKQLRQECLDYWPRGFGNLDGEGFRAYLHEMTGLGVLAPDNDGRGWHLRSANVLSRIGTKDDVEAELVLAAEHSVPDEFLALESRQELPNGRTSPLTAAQTDDVLGDHNNQVRVVLGSPATGIEMAGEAIRAAASVGTRFTLPRIGGIREFKAQLVDGQPGEWRVVLDDLFSVAPNEEACLEALELAQTLRPTAAGVTRSAVIIAGPEQMPLWRKVFEQDCVDGQSAGTVVLRRFTPATLQVWSMDTNMFTDKEARATLLRVTGGWPVLVESVLRRIKGDFSSPGSSGVDEYEALRQLEKHLETPAGRNELFSASGLGGDARLVRAFAAIRAEAGSQGLSRADLDVAAGFEVTSPETDVECLIALQLFNVDDGIYRPEPTLVRCLPS
ncbi:AAA family ATPase [Amycolatopsis sp. lyj-108]|uniref:nSTAND1 domain-containing NTPase n=1 Tax=Amycolatopsis sp. lyj-108 TaxID=2789286 RepID=UPI00397BD4FC